jgi:hypothetical protein
MKQKTKRSRLSEIAAELGRRGAEVANARRTPEQRSAVGRHAVSVRWRRYRKAKVATSKLAVGGVRRAG